ncbi:uncharacterized protein A4U43_C09F3530 [Asparagus officinalis]|uniref:Uncharacterized protein n=1 Tax=Asparagus officinalis TaxID=4686 RepID=A0A5P1E508_ASPOF|nr:uncharacterized protein A4U43_C09F3530 [Asparagus officinalis]
MTSEEMTAMSVTAKEKGRVYVDEQDLADDEFYNDGLHTMTAEETERYSEAVMRSDQASPSLPPLGAKTLADASLSLISLLWLLPPSSSISSSNTTSSQAPSPATTPPLVELYLTVSPSPVSLSYGLTFSSTAAPNLQLGGYLLSSPPPSQPLPFFVGLALQQRKR